MTGASPGSTGHAINARPGCDNSKKRNGLGWAPVDNSKKYVIE